PHLPAPIYVCESATTSTATGKRHRNLRPAHQPHSPRALLLENRTRVVEAVRAPQSYICLHELEVFSKPAIAGQCPINTNPPIVSYNLCILPLIADSRIHPRQ